MRLDAPPPKSPTTSTSKSAMDLTLPELTIKVRALDGKLNGTGLVMQLWKDLFAPHHYLTGELNFGSKVLVATSDEGRPFVFHATTPQPGAVSRAMREHRLVVRPEWQGLGIGPRFSDFVGQKLFENGYWLYGKTAQPGLAGWRCAKNKKSLNWVPTTGTDPVTGFTQKPLDGTGMGFSKAKCLCGGFYEKGKRCQGEADCPKAQEKAKEQREKAERPTKEKQLRDAYSHVYVGPPCPNRRTPRDGRHPNAPMREDDMTVPVPKRQRLA